MNRLTFKAIVLCAAAAALIGAAGGVAATRFVITSPSQIKPGVIQAKHLSKSARAALTGRIGATGDQGSPGLQGIPGVPGTARAYGLVSKPGGLTQSKNVTAVTNPFAGAYCIALAAGIDASQTGMVATPNNDQDSTSFGGGNPGQAIVEFTTPAIDCPAGQLEVITGVRSTTASGSPDGDVRAIVQTQVNQGFFFIVP